MEKQLDEKANVMILQDYFKNFKKDILLVTQKIRIVHYGLAKNIFQAGKNQEKSAKQDSLPNHG